MREVFHGELDGVGRELAALCRLAAEAMEHATWAVLDNDIGLAERVIDGDTDIDAARARCAEHVTRLLALHAPVARDLRLLVTAIQVADKLERMGDLARHVAELVRRRHPEPVLPAGMVEGFAEMGRLAAELACSVQHAIAAPAGTQFTRRVRDDDRIDELHRDLLAAVGHGSGPHAVRTGVDVALLVRFVERFADQAVSISRRLDYVATGDLPTSAGP